jgi:hypothetical protein
VDHIVRDELREIRAAVNGSRTNEDRTAEAAELFGRVALSKSFEEFLTIPAYERLP